MTLDEIIDKVEAERKKQGMHRNALAEIAGVHETTLKSWKQRRTHPTVGALILVADALGLEVKVVKKHESNL